MTTTDDQLLDTRPFTPDELQEIDDKCVRVMRSTSYSAEEQVLCALLRRAIHAVRHPERIHG